MQIHASCVAKSGSAVLLIGEPGSGKSDLALRLLDFGFRLVADDQVILENHVAMAPERLAGLLEIRGLGIVRLDYVKSARVRLIVRLLKGQRAERLPKPDTLMEFPVLQVDPWEVSAPQKVSVGLGCVCGRIPQLVGAFAP
jgi:HPr kinase/phosphorylase